MACGDDFLFGKTPSNEALSRMQQCSPTQFVDAIEAPILIALGGDDQRVTPVFVYEYLAAFLQAH